VTTFFQTIVTGILLGSIYALLGLAIVLIYKSTRVFNLAQGGLLITGAYVFYLLIGQLELPIWISFLLMLLFAALLGLGIERLTLRPLIGQPILAAVMVTLALWAFLDGAVITIWGAAPRSYPPALPVGTFTIGSVTVPQILFLGFVGVTLFLAVFALFFRFHQTGLAMRATAEDHQVAQSMGINVKRVFALSWIIAAAIGAFTGIIMGYRMGLSEYLPLIGLKAFAVVLVGGLESLLGAFIGGMIVGLVESLFTSYLNPVLGRGFGELAPWIILLVVLLFKPYGLFGLKRIERI
jgi:branched-chain amino acid transport system permease protein